MPPLILSQEELRAWTGVFLVEMRSTTGSEQRMAFPAEVGQALDQRDMRMMGYGDTPPLGKNSAISFLQSGVPGVTPIVPELLGVRLCNFSRGSRGASVSARSLVRLDSLGTNSPSRNHVQWETRGGGWEGAEVTRAVSVF